MTLNANGARPSPSAPTSQIELDSHTIRKAVRASSIGNATEWYDYGVYAATAAYLTHAFFPGEFGVIGTMAGFAISFVLRPLGGLVWGPLGDRLGRRAVLSLTIVLISVATGLIGLLPTEAVAGVWAPILLIVMRMIQGFSTGGEYGGAATYVAEYAPDDKRGRYGSLFEVATYVGLTAGTAFVLVLEFLLTTEQMQTWGWRIPFLVAFPLGLIGVYLRSRLEDTPVFLELEELGENKGSAWSRIVDLVTTYWRPVLIMFALASACNIVVYTFLSYSPLYLKGTIGLSPAAGTSIVLIAQIVIILLIPVFGRWSDSTGRKPMWWASLGGLFILALPIFWLMDQGYVAALIGFALFGLLIVPQPATFASTFPAMFPTHVRFAGFALAYNLASAIFGGTVGLINEAVNEATDWTRFPALYMMFGCAIGMVALIFMKETVGGSLRGNAIPGRKGEVVDESV